ncbi:rRNA maturation RNase YbeY [Novosphingobium flavum]|uniref:Endoribonuclease YbeY n=1 Tax=Novosphingobium flavum TaxID=1778672 RepID=A0A7X1KN80_9SPHN|nr:rRNA maturation RNase YbeY [Novosphingobium flavum]MBC2667421.1 rRNA maturation RNase YbeY [Novosphingobium flavum]
MLALDIDIEEPWPKSIDWADLAEAAAEAAMAVAPELANPRLSASVLFTSDDELHVLNKEWRAKDKATNVLSFPMIARDALIAMPHAGAPEMLGDLALSCETCTREAAEKGVPLHHHAAHLVVHGLLHLAGHDHELGEAEAEVMEALETKALAKMGIADPYAGEGG